MMCRALFSESGLRATLQFNCSLQLGPLSDANVSFIRFLKNSHFCVYISCHCVSCTSPLAF